MDSTWFKGTRKAIGRTPHLLMGTKSVEDPLITVWTKNISTAHSGLTALATAAELVAERSTAAAQQLRKLVGDFAPIYAAIRDPTLPASSADDAAPERILERRAAIETKLARLDAEVGLKASELSANVKQKVDAVRPIIKSIETLLTKRSHKKIDYDRVVASRASQAAKAGTTVPDVHETSSEEQRLYEDFDARVRKTVPQFFIHFDQFLKGLTLEVSKAQTDIARAWLEGAESAARSMGVTSDIEAALKTWRSEFSTIQPAIEALDIIDTTRPLPSRLVDPTPPEHPSHDGFMVRTFHRITGQVVLPRFLGGSLFAGEEAVKDLEAESPEKATSPTVETLKSPTIPAAEKDASAISTAPAAAAAASLTGAAAATSASLAGAASTGAASTGAASTSIGAASTGSSTAPSGASTSASTGAPSGASTGAAAAAPTAAAGEWVVAIYPFSGGDGDLSFATGDRIKVVDHGDEGDTEWWCGSKDGAVGLFPRNYVRTESAPPVPGRVTREARDTLPEPLTEPLSEPEPSEPKLPELPTSQETPALPHRDGLSHSATVPDAIVPDAIVPEAVVTETVPAPHATPVETLASLQTQTEVIPPSKSLGSVDPNSQATKEDSILPKPAGDELL